MSPRTPARPAQADRTLVSGTFATRRRTVTGILGQLGIAGMEDEEIRAALRLVGLPGRAMEDPEFPVSLDQELTALALMIDRLGDERPLVAVCIEVFSAVGINFYGVLGLAMQHAPTVTAALEVMYAYPELCWGHCRGRLAQRANGVVFTAEFDVDVSRRSPAEAAALREYCLTRDLVSAEHLIGDVIGRSVTPVKMTLPFPKPAGEVPEQFLPCPVEFDAVAAEIHYSLNLLNAPVVHAGELPFRRYEKIARAFSRVLADEVDVTEQVTRLLWAYEPAPSREDLAAILGIGTRTLARRLADAGTAYGELLKRVNGERARNYLRHSGMTVAEIAERMGYSDPAAFTRAFQNWEGVSPSRWRAENPSAV